jgi:hypothetical protein
MSGDGYVMSALDIIASDDYKFVMNNFRQMQRCPQCDAEQRLDSGEYKGKSEAHRAWRLACCSILLEPHKCGKRQKPA